MELKAQQAYLIYTNIVTSKQISCTSTSLLSCFCLDICSETHSGFSCNDILYCHEQKEVIRLFLSCLLLFKSRIYCHLLVWHACSSATFIFLMRREEDNPVSIFKGVLMLMHTFVLILLVVFQVIIMLKWILMLCWTDGSSRW